MNLGPEERLRRSTWDATWAPPFVHLVSRPEVTYTRCERDVPPFNSVYRVDAEGERLVALVDEVSTAHRGVASRWALASPWPSALPDLLARAGYPAPELGTGYVLPVERHEPVPHAGLSVVRVASIETLEVALEVAFAAFGIRWQQDADYLRHVLSLATAEAPSWPHFLVLEADGRPICSGSLRIHPHLGFGYLMGGATLAEARGRGAYSALLDARIAFARAAGLPYVGLYASPLSAPVVSRRGFAVYDTRMAFWQRPAVAPPASDE